MINALRSASTGMEAQQLRIDSIANDLANVNTSAYKKTRAAFEDLYYDQIKTPGNLNNQSTQSPSGIQIGHGTKLTAVYKVFNEASTQSTANPLDLAIEGQGFFKVADSQGNFFYTRNGTFQRDSQGNIVTPNGEVLQPSLVIPSNATSISIAKDGTVSVATSDQETAQNLGQIQLAMFQNPAGLKYNGQNLYSLTDASGQETLVTAGQDGSGSVAQGFLENSNVDIGEALIQMIVAQRSYEANSKVIESSDRMMQQANNLI